MRLCLALAAALLISGTATAQVGEEILKSYAGNWQILPVDGSPGCGVRLDLAATIGGRLARPAADCAAKVPAIKDASAWYPSDGVAFFNPLRQRVMAFEEDETTLLRSPSVAKPVYYLIPARPGLTRAPQARAIPGVWTLRKGANGTPCTLTLAAANVAPSAPHPLRAGAGCPAGYNSWRLEELTLFLEGPNDKQMRLPAAADGRFDADVGGWRLIRAASLR